jgi:hypothetical protein
MPKKETTKFLITHAVAQVNAVVESLAAVAREMKRLAELLPEYAVVLSFRGVGEILGLQLIAEIGNVRRFSKKGSPHLRKALFQVMDCLLKHSPCEDSVCQLLDRKRAENKHYYSYMNAGAAKFLRIYYARVNAYLRGLEVNTFFLNLLTPLIALLPCNQGRALARSFYPLLHLLKRNILHKSGEENPSFWCLAFLSRSNNQEIIQEIHTNL